jgi:hypothetical protein
MKKYIVLLSLTTALCVSAQEHADFTIIGANEGTGTFINALLSDFTWNVTGAVNNISIQSNEPFDDGNAFEANFGQADNRENLYIQNYPNGPNTIGTQILSRSILTLRFDAPTPTFGWGFCLVDIDVENVLIAAVDQFGNQVPPSAVNSWLIELFDANLSLDGINIPKWDSINAAILGSDTPPEYIVYNDTVIGGMPSSEAPAAFFMPDIALDSLIIIFENLQDTYFTSYHFFIASMNMSDIQNHHTSGLTVFPNPVTNFFSLQHLRGDAIVEVFDIAGQCILQTTAGNNRKFDVSDWNTGVYVVRVHSDNQVEQLKIVKIQD